MSKARVAWQPHDRVKGYGNPGASSSRKHQKTERPRNAYVSLFWHGWAAVSRNLNYTSLLSGELKKALLCMQGPLLRPCHGVRSRHSGNRIPYAILKSHLGWLVGLGLTNTHQGSRTTWATDCLDDQLSWKVQLVCSISPHNKPQQA